MPRLVTAIKDGLTTAYLMPNCCRYRRDREQYDTTDDEAPADCARLERLQPRGRRPTAEGSPEVQLVSLTSMIDLSCARPSFGTIFRATVSWDMCKHVLC